MVSRRPSIFIAAIILAGFWPASVARAVWFDNSWKFRRSVEALWDAENAGGDQLCMAEFYTAGHMQPNGEDVRVATPAGRLVATRVLDVSGDRVRVAFATPKSEKNFFVYFGNDKPTPPPASPANLKINMGLLIELKPFSGGPNQSAEQLQQLWDRQPTLLGATIVPRPFLGFNPTGEQDRTISRISGSLLAPVNGEYLFAGSADDRAALFIDGKSILFIPGSVGDIRYNTKINLTRGRHDFAVYHLNTGGEFRLSIGWQPPGAPKVDVIPPGIFGFVPLGVVGALEEVQKPMSADFQAEYRGELFFEDQYSHRYRLSARPPKLNTPVQYDWDFGDGQTGSGASVEHVFLESGIFPVTIKFSVGPNSDSQTSKLIVTRNLDRITNPQIDDVKDQAAIVARYDLEKLSGPSLPAGVLLLARAEQIDPMLKAAGRLVGDPRHVNVARSLLALDEASRVALAARKLDALAAMWNQLPQGSDLNPDAACQAADFFLWQIADFDHALRILAPLASNREPRFQRRYAQALLLAQKPDEAKKILAVMRAPGDPIRRAALSGASARSIESFIHDADAEAGEEAWEKWQSSSPADFLEGYSLWLRVKLMELRKLDSPAARVAEAFANAVPNSSYSPRLLSEASTLLRTTDPAKSEALRQQLKKRYPEDPMSQP